MSIHPTPSYFKQEASKLFIDLTRHYTTKFDSPSERIGNLMLFMDMIEVSFCPTKITLTV
jgi:hypothetical protein